MLVLVRTGEVFEDAKGVEGIRGELTLGPVSFPTVERGDGYKMLPLGTYECEMGWISFSGGRTARAIRVLGEYSMGRIYVHPANYPSQLAGCIAPGMTIEEDGVGRSRDAMRQIFDALGGWLKDRPVRLLVSDGFGEEDGRQQALV